MHIFIDEMHSVKEQTWTQTSLYFLCKPCKFLIFCTWIKQYNQDNNNAYL